MTLREMLQQQVDLFEQIGQPALVERFVLRNGVEQTPMKRIGHKRKNKECFRNAAEFVLSGLGGTYTEGFAFRKGLPFPMEHAWVTINGQAMDPTWDRPEECEYLGVQFSEEELIDQLMTHKVYGLLVNAMVNTDLIFKKDPELKEWFDGFKSNTNR